MASHSSNSGETPDVKLRDIMLAQPLNDLERLDWLSKDDLCRLPQSEALFLLPTEVAS